MSHWRDKPAATVMATRAQFRHEDVATVPRGWKVRTVTQYSGHQARIAFPPGPRRRGAGRLISILHPQGENPGKCGEGRRLPRSSGSRRTGKAEGSNPRYSGDPRWTTAKYGGQCKKCGRRIQPGEQIFYYPQTRTVYCAGENCGKEASRDFASHAFDEGNPRGKTKTREQVEKMQAKAVKFLRDVVGNDDKADEIENLSLEDYAAKKKVTLGNPHERTGAWQDVEFRGIPKSARLPGGSLMGMPPGKKRKPRNPKPGYLAWIRIKGGIDRYGSQVFKTRREALVDAANIIRQVKNDPDVTWRHEIETYGSVRENPHISQAWDQASPRYRAQVLGMAGIGEPKQKADLSWKDLPKEAKDALTGKPKKNKFDTAREKAAYMAGLSSGSRRLGGALETLRRKRATRLERMTGRGLGRRNPKRRRRNAAPDQGVSHERKAKALYQKFHGKAPKEVLELQESAAIRGEYTSLGDLVELVVKSPAGESLRIGFAGEKVKLASSPNGGQLYFLGGNQTLDGNLARFQTDTTKDLVDLGEAQSIVYRAAKDFTGFKSSDWEHEFGEESGERPSAFYDKLKQRIFLVGGTYRVERPGIVD